MDSSKDDKNDEIKIDEKKVTRFIFPPSDKSNNQTQEMTHSCVVCSKRYNPINLAKDDVKLISLSNNYYCLDCQINMKKKRENHQCSRCNKEYKINIDEQIPIFGYLCDSCVNNLAIILHHKESLKNFWHDIRYFRDHFLELFGMCYDIKTKDVLVEWSEYMGISKKNETKINISETQTQIFKNKNHHTRRKNSSQRSVQKLKAVKINQQIPDEVDEGTVNVRASALTDDKMYLIDIDNHFLIWDQNDGKEENRYAPGIADKTEGKWRLLKNEEIILAQKRGLKPLLSKETLEKIIPLIPTVAEVFESLASQLKDINDNKHSER